MTIRDAETIEAQQAIQFVVAPLPPPPPPPTPPPPEPPGPTESPTPASTVPAAADDGYTTPFGSAVTIGAPGVLRNDNPNGGGGMSAALVSGVANGTLSFNPNGSFTYVPNQTFAGADAFTYRASNGNGTSNVATVSIVVSAPTGPFGLHAEYVSGNTVRLDWLVPPGVELTDFVIDGGPGPGTTTVSLSVGGPQPTRTSSSRVASTTPTSTASRQTARRPNRTKPRSM